MAPLHRMTPWRLAGAISLASAFALTGWQVQRLIVDRPWSDTLMWGSAIAATLAAVCLLVWTWVATDNARRLIGPAATRELPNPKVAVLMWLLPLAFVGLAVGVVAYLGAQIEPGADDTVSAIPLGVALLSLLLAIPLTYRPLFYLAGVVRQVGGHSAQLARWMWVPVVLGLVGLASLVALRVGAVDDAAGEFASRDAGGWAPLWVVAVVGIVPCIVVVLLAWRASATVEEAISIAASRRRSPGEVTAWSPPAQPAARRAGRPAPSPVDLGGAVHLVPGADRLRLVMVSMLAGLALLSVVGAAVMVMFWAEANDGGLAPGQNDRAWNALDALHTASRFLAFVLLAVVGVWTFVVVLNARRASGRRRNPLIAALAWPVAGYGIWLAADRLIVDGSNGRVVLGFAAQAAVLAVPFLLLERSADAVGARRTPIRITYVLGVVLLVHVQGLGGLSTIQETADTAEFGRLAGYLMLGALVQLLSTLAVTAASQSITMATEHEVEHHNMLVAQRAPGTKVVAPELAVGS
ncbi:MAG: hypothetical protein WBP59_07735 [Ilumatobacteraceae bacterium]